MQGFQFIPNPPFALAAANDALTVLRWQQLQQQMPLGTVLTGTIFARAPFGIFYDAGVGFPVRMNIPEFGLEQAEVTGVTARDEEGYPALGSIISGRLIQFDVDTRQQLIAGRL